MAEPATLQIIGMFTNVMTMQKKWLYEKTHQLHTTHSCLHKALHLFIMTRVCIQSVVIPDDNIGLRLSNIQSRQICR
jgi:hypothetical protein